LHLCFRYSAVTSLPISCPEAMIGHARAAAPLRITLLLYAGAAEAELLLWTDPAGAWDGDEGYFQSVRLRVPGCWGFARRISFTVIQVRSFADRKSTRLNSSHVSI